jgi:hypothetical protein
MLPQALIMTRLDELPQLGARIYVFNFSSNFSFFGDMEAITVQKTYQYCTTEFDFEEGF